MKKSILVISVFVLTLVFSTQKTHAQFGLKKLKDKVTKTVKDETNSLKNKKINQAFAKLNDICVGAVKSKKSVKITSTSQAFNAYNSLKNQITEVQNLLKQKEYLTLIDKSNDLKGSIKTIKELEPNADLSSECKRITNFKKFLK